ncbi:MAG: hypothetical protein ACRDGL_04445, partial [Candidatus Limnocylindrales bacterium]
PEWCATPTPTASPTPTLTQPAIDTEADEQAIVGQPFHDVAKLTNGDEPTGTITFTLYGPSDSASCKVANTVTSVHVTVNGNGTYTSPDVTVSVPGNYWWIARYNGDDDNATVRGTCGDDEEMTGVAPATTPTPTVAPTPTPTVAPTPTPTLPNTGGSPTPSPSPLGSVEPATGSPTPSPSGTVEPAAGSPTPIHTLPPTDLGGPSTPAGQSPVLPLVLLALGGLAFGVTLLKPAPARRRR